MKSCNSPINIRFTNIFLPRCLPKCCKRYQSICSRIKGKQWRIYKILQMSIQTSYSFMLLELTQNALHCNIWNDRTDMTISDSWSTSWIRTGVGRFHSCLYKWGMASAACACGAEEQTVDHVASNVQSTDLLIDCTAWRLSTMRQSNGCSTPASRSSAAKQWLEQLSQKKKKTSWM